MIREIATTSLFLLITTGCSYTTTTTTTVTNGDSVSNMDGTGTGNVAGVEIEVLELANHKSGITHSVNITATTTGADETETWDVHFGEVSVLLAQENNGPVSLTVDGLKYGTVAEGDRLVIDADRNVMVNDKTRTPE
jgi:hypothetical protein